MRANSTVRVKKIDLDESKWFKGAEGDRIRKEFERNRGRMWRQERELELGEVKAKTKELERCGARCSLQ